MTTRLRNWAVAAKGGLYQAPETVRSFLIGDVYNHPKYSDGHRIATSCIRGVKGRLITCDSREYLLDGPPCEDYVKFCYENKIIIDPENPIKVKYVPGDIA